MPDDPRDEERRRKLYTSAAINVTFEGRLCVHAAECLRGLPQVFDLDSRPWISPDAATADDVAKVVERCPSGALQYERLDGGTQEQPPDQPVVFPIPNGPLAVHGDVPVINAEGQRLSEGFRHTLCRCGGSSNKPFCDNTHRRIGFQA